MSEQASIVTPSTTPSGRARIKALDVIRGFALIGILPANVQPIADSAGAVLRAGPGTESPWWGILVYQRFYVIFALLFGVGFSLLLRSATDRVSRPRFVLLRRLLVLLGFGLAHHLLWPGDILAVYALVGLFVLLPSTWLPRWAVLGLSLVAVAAALVGNAGHFAVVPGLFLLGSALTRYGVVDRCERPGSVPLVSALAFAVTAVPVLWWQSESGDPRAMTAAGLLFAGCYISVLLSLLQTPARPMLRILFEHLGRMALTNYLSATILVLAFVRITGDSPRTWTSDTVLLIALAVLTVQWGFSTLWLRRFGCGPIERLWRWATRGRRPGAPRTFEN